MMGGELEDIATEASGTLDLNEVAEAEAEGDLLAGRQQNRGRVEMMRAIRAMSRASTALNESSLDQALRDERTALDNLMRAFSRSRFILRALTQRERIDLERRLSGLLNSTVGLSDRFRNRSRIRATIALRRLLADVAAGDSAAVKASALALLREDPGSEVGSTAGVACAGTHGGCESASGGQPGDTSLDAARGILPMTPRRRRRGDQCSKVRCATHRESQAQGSRPQALVHDRLTSGGFRHRDHGRHRSGLDHVALESSAGFGARRGFGA